MTTFIETPRFPDSISEGSGGGPTFQTDVFTGMAGVEQRNQNWQRVRHAYQVQFDIRDKEDMDAVRAFFFNARGMAVGFRYKDWNDYVGTAEPTVIGYDASNEPIATGVADGANKVFRLCRTYSAGNTYKRRVFKPVAGTVVVYDNGVARDPAGYVLDTTTGTITFTAAPTNTHVITADFEFDVPVRFNVDVMQSTNQGFTAESWQSIELIELKLEDAS